MSTIEKIHISWEKFHQLSKLLAQEIIKNHPSIKGIVAVTRGGMIPACIVASELEIRTIEVFAIKSYQNNFSQSKIEIITEPKNALADKGEGWIIIDELVDSGNTLNHIRETLPKASFYSVFTKMNHPNITSFMEEYPKESWVYLPWEKYD